MAIFRRMSSRQKLELISRLREDALALKAAWLRQQHPDEGEDRIRVRLRAWQMYGRTDLD